jgi:hypothetical protein
MRAGEAPPPAGDLNLLSPGQVNETHCSGCHDDHPSAARVGLSVDGFRRRMVHRAQSSRASAGAIIGGSASPKARLPRTLIRRSRKRTAFHRSRGMSSLTRAPETGGRIGAAGTSVSGNRVRRTGVWLDPQSRGDRPNPTQRRDFPSPWNCELAISGLLTLSRSRRVSPARAFAHRAVPDQMMVAPARA